MGNFLNPSFSLERLILLSISGFFLPSFFGVSKADDLSSSSLSSLPIHHEVEDAPEVFPSKELLVSLEAFLGKKSPDKKHLAELRLTSPGKPLELRDSTGLIHKSTDIRISWRKVALKKPKHFARQVLGQFASYESAERFASILKSKGIKSIIARPLDWEVWVAKDLKLPKEMEAQSFSKTIFEEVKPVLKLPSKEYFLTGPVFIDAPDGLVWKGGVYLGPFLLKADAYGSWTFIEKVPLERYLLGVVPHEIGFQSPSAALAVQAVLARTWALANIDRFKVDGYHLCSNTQCQVYKDPQQANYEVSKAISKTTGKVLTWKGKPINAVYHATNGGVTASGNEAWSMKPVAYLKPFLDGAPRWKGEYSLPLDKKTLERSFLKKRDGAYGNTHYLFRWKRVLKAQALQKALINAGKDIGVPETIRILDRGPSGRVLALEILGNDKESSVVLTKDAIRRTIKILPSTLFILEDARDGMWKFSGGGFGHGAGLSQAGAIDMALRGWSPLRILKHYYPGTRYESLQ